MSVRKELDTLVILDPQGKQELCRHQIPVGKGVKVINTDHKRDKAKTIEELMKDLCTCALLIAENCALLLPDYIHELRWLLA